ncbi:MAG: hypothetical protein RI893_1161, partial [Pseudomonadota bacterium]|jgi:hypothetical protein
LIDIVLFIYDYYRTETMQNQGQKHTIPPRPEGRGLLELF